MIALHGRAWKVASRAASFAVVAVALVAACLVARRMVASEAAEAEVLVADGLHALAHDDRAHAVLDFERARRLAPRSGFVRAALAVAAPRDAEPALACAAGFVTAREWSALVTTAGWLAGLGWAIVVAQRRGGLPLRVTAAATGAFVVGFAGLMVSQACSLAVVTGTDTAALVAPYAGAAAVGPLRTGDTVAVGARHDAFVRVRGEDGLAGWVPQTSLEPVAGSGG